MKHLTHTQQWNWKNRTKLTTRDVARRITAEAVWQYRQIVDRECLVRPLDVFQMFEAARARHYTKLCQLFYRYNDVGKLVLDLKNYIDLMWLYPTLKEHYAKQLAALDDEHRKKKTRKA